MIFAIVLTALTQVGGAVWLLALILRGTGPARVLRHGFLLISLYTAFSVGAWALSPVFGRVALPCFGTDVAGLRAERLAFCVMNRSYVVPELADELVLVGQALATEGYELRTLDAGFPIPMPMVPHLTHAAGRAVDIALPLDGMRAPFGYFAFVQPQEGDTQPCDGQIGRLRWDLPGLQPATVTLDEGALRAQLTAILDRPRLEVLIEPHLEARLGFDSPRLRFQGCHAARHDDHIHIRLN